MNAFADTRRIAIFRALQLGDMLCCVPALRALRKRYPDAHIVLIGLPWAQTFVARYSHLLDELIVFPGAVGFPEQRETDEHLDGFCAMMRERHFDLAIQMHGSGGVANEIVARWNARTHAGFIQPAEASRPGSFIAWPDDLPEPARYNALMHALGCDAGDQRLEIPLSAEDLDERQRLMDAFELEARRLILVHVGAQLPSRRWPVERFTQVARELACDGWQIAITGSASETTLTSALAASLGPLAADLTGRTSLGGLAALVGCAQLVVCNDTGLSHVAAAMRTPSVVIASGSDTRRWAPLDHERHRVLADDPPCRPCSYRECPFGHPCALAIDVQQVLNTARMQLNRYASQPLTTTHDD
jgi:ADP-heptose:LPS heptosyltransferase